MERELQQLYFEQAIKCATQQVVITIKYFKVLAASYYIVESLSENLSQGNHLPTHFKRFLDSLDKQLTSILDFLSP